jgi:hypothetical protein
MGTPGTSEGTPEPTYLITTPPPVPVGVPTTPAPQGGYTPEMSMTYYGIVDSFYGEFIIFARGCK